MHFGRKKENLGAQFGIKQQSVHTTDSSFFQNLKTKEEEEYNTPLPLQKNQTDSIMGKTARYVAGTLQTH